MSRVPSENLNFCYMQDPNPRSENSPVHYSTISMSALRAWIFGTLVNTHIKCRIYKNFSPLKSTSQSKGRDHSFTTYQSRVQVQFLAPSPLQLQLRVVRSSWNHTGISNAIWSHRVRSRKTLFCRRSKNDRSHALTLCTLTADYAT